MLAELRRIFDKYQQDGRVRMEYDINVCFGRLSGQNEKAWHRGARSGSVAYDPLA